jgi:hypothetical protein
MLLWLHLPVKKEAESCVLLITNSTTNMGRSGELSDFECGLVIGCHISKKSVGDITALLKFPKSTVGDMIVKVKPEGTTTTKHDRVGHV